MFLEALCPSEQNAVNLGVFSLPETRQEGPPSEAHLGSLQFHTPRGHRKHALS